MMSKKAFRSQASSSRAASGAFGASQEDAKGFTSVLSFGGTASSSLSYLYEPPDLSGVSDPNIVVAFKALQKKDGTTKARGLEELQACIDSIDKDELQETILEAWIKVYPRTSIDNSRRVRLLAHTLQGQIASAYGKRLAKYMPSVTACWLAGAEDPDKTVSRAAQESFRSIFATEEKLHGVWRLYQTNIVQHLLDLVTRENEHTLSDERVTSPDDATMKYARTTGCAININTKFLENTSKKEREKSQEIWSTLLSNQNLWKLVTHSDSFVRRALCRFLVPCVDHFAEALDASQLSLSLLTSGLHTAQPGSSLDYIKAIIALTRMIPSVWDEHYSGTGKKSAFNRFCGFLRRGSQGAAATYWVELSNLFLQLAKTSFFGKSIFSVSASEDGDHHSILKLMDAFREGINSKSEARQNLFSAWDAYLDVCEVLLTNQTLAAPSELLKSLTMPLITQHVRPVSHFSEWTVVCPKQEELIVKACRQTLSVDKQSFAREWHTLSAIVIQDIQTSLPEQSKEYTRSQDSIATETRKWYHLQGLLVATDKSGVALQSVENGVVEEISCLISLLKNRAGKPYGAAAALSAAMQAIPQILLSNATTKDALTNFVQKNLSELILTPSANNLVELLDFLGEHIDTSQTLSTCISNLEASPASEVRERAIQRLLTISASAQNEELVIKTNRLLHDSLEHAIVHDDEPSWGRVIAVVGNVFAPDAILKEFIARISGALVDEENSLAALHGLDKALARNEARLKDIAVNSAEANTLTNLLVVSEIANTEISSTAQRLASMLEIALKNSGKGAAAHSVVSTMIKKELGKASKESLSISSLVNQTERLLSSEESSDAQGIVSELIPDRSQWNDALSPFVSIKPNYSLAVTNVMSSAIDFIVPDGQTREYTALVHVPLDSDGYSRLWRMVEFSRRVVDTPNLLSLMTEERRLTTFFGLAVVMQIAADNLSISNAMPLWRADDPETESELIESVAACGALLNKWRQSEPMSILIPQLLHELGQGLQGQTSYAYYSARAYLAMVSEIVDVKGYPAISGDDQPGKDPQKPGDVFSELMYTSSCETKRAAKICNDLLSELTGAKYDSNEASLRGGLQRLLLLNCTLHRSDELVENVSQQRLIFFVQHLVQQLEIDRSSSFTTEVLRSLQVVFPAVKEIYGSFWGKTFVFLQTALLKSMEDAHLPMVHASLRLLTTIRKQNFLEANDDLLEAWEENRPSIATSLVKLAEEMRDKPDVDHQPRRIVNELLQRQLSDLSRYVSSEADLLYGILAAASSTLQHTAYNLLHQIIPSEQEETSLNKALAKDLKVSLPEELLSLIVTAPRTADFGGAASSNPVEISLRSYLLSWLLVFDHWKNASNLLQADYAQSLSEGSYTNDLLTFISGAMITERPRPIDASKYEIEAYIPDIEPPEKDRQWLLIHLYHLCLMHLPTQSKNWWRGSTSRQVTQSVEMWTEKYFSPIIIASDLNAVKEWAPSQESDDHPLTVKISLSAREVTASIPVDEQLMSIAIRLPTSYPLARVEVEGIHRVAVPEKKWASWIRNAQGQLTVAGEGGGSALIDCLIAWRKNVTAAMKGQSECAICYSVVGADRTLPTKVCKTCKNKFHGSCLYRWFSSSNSSSCPLCRNTFTYS